MMNLQHGFIATFILRVLLTRKHEYICRANQNKIKKVKISTEGQKLV